MIRITKLSRIIDLEKVCMYESKIFMKEEGLKKLMVFFINKCNSFNSYSFI